MLKYVRMWSVGIALVAFSVGFGVKNVGAVMGPEPTPGLTNSEIKEDLQDNFGYILGDPKGDLRTKSIINGKSYPITFSKYEDTGLVYFGNEYSVSSATGQKNDYVNSKPRFFGITSDGKTPFTNFRFPDDIPTDGDVLGRKYTSEPWLRKNRNKVTNNYEPGNGYYNLVSQVEWMVVNQYLENGEPLGNVKGTDEMDTWLTGLVDKYKTDHDHWDSSKYFKRTDKRDQFSLFSKSKLRDINYIAMPPTEYTSGLVNNFYYCGSVSSSGYCYDVYWVNQLSMTSATVPDFTADKLTVTKKNAMFYDVRLKGTLYDKSVKDNPVMSYARYRVGGGAWQNITNPLVDDRHGKTWLKGTSKTELMGSVFIPPNTPEGSLVEIESGINPLDGISSGKRGIKEDDVSNNVARTSFRTVKIPLCAVGGDGTTKDYSISRTVATSYDKDTDTTTYTTYCDRYERRLNNLASADYNSTKHTLMGVWSKNTSSHTKKGDINAMGSVPSDEVFNVALTGPFVEKLTKLGIKNPKRTIRAGRSVQLYGTIEMELNLRSFNGSADLTNKKNAILNEVRNTIETRGILVDEDYSLIKNNNGKTRVKAQIDTGRDMVTNTGTLSTTTFGDASCTQITESARTYKITIPVKSLSEGGSQKTTQSTFIDEKSYAVKDKTADFVTGINTPNGLYSIANSFKMDASMLDSGLSGTMWCTSEEEEFRVKGNIFDDVRAEDKSDDVDKKSGSWDF